MVSIGQHVLENEMRMSATHDLTIREDDFVSTKPDTEIVPKEEPPQATGEFCEPGLAYLLPYIQKS